MASDIFSTLLKKSFEIIEDSARGNPRNTAMKTMDIIELLKEHKHEQDEQKKRINNQFRAATISPSEKRAMERQNNIFSSSNKKKLHEYSDPFEKVVTKKNKPNTDFPKFQIKERRPLQRSVEKYDAHEMDYGSQQKIAQKKKNARMLLTAVGLGIGLIILVGVGLLS